ncbi:MAG TPA: hypothetical protein VL282_11760 [Tepidisphaeraceae bacterium]|jgi:hypothetical protein|nr:hypothetical protein [Tepidisphaeraceae bacterium]
MIGWVLFFSAVLVPGYALTSAILGRERRSAVELAGLVLALGGGTLSTLLFWFSLTGAIPSRWLLSLIIVASIGMITWLAARRRCALPDLRPDPPKLEREDLWLIPAVPVIVFAIFAVSVHSLAFGVIEWDDTAIWALKAKVVAHDALRNHPWYFHDPAMSYSHQDYPLLMPFMRAAVYGALGHVADAGGKVVGPLLFTALGMIVYSTSRRFLARGPSAALTALYLTIPPMLRFAGSGMSDVPLAVFSCATLAYLVRWLECASAGGLQPACNRFPTEPIDRLKSARRMGALAELILAAIFASCAAFTKNEGLAFFAVVSALLFALALLKKDRRAIGAGITFALVAGLILLPWLIFRTELPRTHEDYGSKFTLWRILDNTPRLIPIARLFAAEFSHASTWSIFWFLPIAATLLNPSALRRRSVQFLWLVLLGHLAVYVLTYMVTPWDLYELAVATTTRLVLHLSPAAVLITATCMGTTRTSARKSAGGVVDPRRSD